MNDEKKQPIGAKRRQRREEHRTCRHFTGVMNNCCAVGIEYETFRKSAGVQLPCLLLHRDKPQAKCEGYAAYTKEELDAEERETNALIARHALVMPFVSEWRKKPPRGKREIVECPACKGRLHLSQSSYNGHVHGKCETEGCVSWME